MFKTLGNELSLVTKLHSSTSRNYLARMNDNKVEAMLVAKQYGFDYWDGDRRYGYGGHRYILDRWKPVAEALIERFGLNEKSKILDIGCGKGFLLYEIQKLLPGVSLTGVDYSKYAVENRHPELNARYFYHDARTKLPFLDKEFDLAISLATFHNFHLYELEIAVPELQRVSRKGYLMVESFRNELEMFNLECWALTAETIMDVDEWKWLYSRLGFEGDYEFIYFE